VAIALTVAEETLEGLESEADGAFAKVRVLIMEFGNALPNKSFCVLPTSTQTVIDPHARSELFQRRRMRSRV
jgi:hypothetical protein